MNSNSIQRTRVKICGITRSEDAQAAITAGADAIGLVFYQQSPRAVSIDQARQLCAQLPPFISVVALTVNADKAFVEQLLTELPIDLLQFHGDEQESFCSQFQKPYIKAVRVKADTDISAEFDRFASARALLLDTYRRGVPGGTGDTFDWGRIPKQIAHSIILAGGLKPDNVAEAVNTVAPFAVDVSSGVEVSPGIKDREKIQLLLSQIKKADENHLGKAVN